MRRYLYWIFADYNVIQSDELIKECFKGLLEGFGLLVFNLFMLFGVIPYSGNVRYLLYAIGILCVSFSVTLIVMYSVAILYMLYIVSQEGNTGLKRLANDIMLDKLGKLRE